jgi:hypothetical protein
MVIQALAERGLYLCDYRETGRRASADGASGSRPRRSAGGAAGSAG